MIVTPRTVPKRFKPEMCERETIDYYFAFSPRTKLTRELMSFSLSLLENAGMLPRTLRPFIIELKMRSSLTSSCHCPSVKSRAWLNRPFEVFDLPSLPWHEMQ